MMRALLYALSTRPRIGAWLSRLPATRRLVRRFVAGTTADEALAVVAELNARGIAGAVTYLGENVRSHHDTEQATAMYLHLLDEIKRRELRALPSLKLTHLGLDLDETLCVANLRSVLEHGRAVGTRVWIDMESSVYTDRTLSIYTRVRQTYDHVACVVQAALRRTPGDVERLIPLGATIRLCKGAYREPPAIAYPDKRDVDRAYAALSERLLAPDARARGVYAGFATHDERLIEHVQGLVARQGIGRTQFEFQMLHGVRPGLAQALHDAGHTIRVLVSFGEDWYGFFMRRLAERPANLLFLLRNLGRR